MISAPRAYMRSLATRDDNTALSGHVKDELTQFVSSNRADKTAETDYQNMLHIGLRSRVSIGCGSLTPAS